MQSYSVFVDVSQPIVGGDLIIKNANTASMKFSPDKDRILYVSDQDSPQNWNVYSANPDGSKPHVVDTRRWIFARLDST